jgi:hypothetical protein
MPPSGPLRHGPSADRGQGYAFVVAHERRPIPLPARRARDPSPPVPQTGHSPREALDYTAAVQVGLAAFGLRPGQAMQLTDQ